VKHARRRLHGARREHHGGGAGSGAAATAYGGVYTVTIVDGGQGYTYPVVDFDLPDGPGGVQAKGHVASIALGDLVDGMDENGTIRSNGVVVDSLAPATRPRRRRHPQRTLFDPIALRSDVLNPHLATATSRCLSTRSSWRPSFRIHQGAGRDNHRPNGTGATATAALDNGVISAITVKKPGSGYVLPGGIRKFVDTLPGLTPAGRTTWGSTSRGGA